MKHLPRCPICGEAVRLAWDEATRTAVIRHHFKSPHIKEHEFRSPSRRETSVAWTDWVSFIQERRARWNRPLIWNGFNTRQVVAYCVAWQYDLCHIYSISPAITTHQAVLCIEPADTMRGSCLCIPLNAAVVRKHSTWKYHNHNGELTGHGQYIMVLQPEQYCHERWAPPIFKEFKIKQDHRERLINAPKYVVKLDPDAYFPHIQHPSMPKVTDGGLPIGAYAKDKDGDTYSCDYQYKGTPEPWPNPLKPPAIDLFPYLQSRPYPSSYTPDT